MPRKRRQLPGCRMLLTGFEPFGGSHVNPSQEVVQAIAAEPNRLERVDLHSLILPVESQRGPASLLGFIDEVRPHAVVCLGESARADAVTIERVFINLADYRIPDNAGTLISNQPITLGGPTAYFSTLPIESVCGAVAKLGIPVACSLSAGAFLCNHVAYAMMHHLRRRRSVRAAGFVHLPRLPEQTEPNFDRPCMPLAQQIRAVKAIIAAVRESIVAAPAVFTRPDS